ncbi:MAG: hypothetical protein QXM92_01585 [Candidatus Anstonellales archaeon]
MLITPIRFVVDVNPYEPPEMVAELFEKARNCTLVADDCFREQVDEEYVLDYWAENGIDIDDALDVCEDNVNYVLNEFKQWQRLETGKGR